MKPIAQFNRIQWLMLMLLAALIPALISYSYFYHWAIWIQLSLSIATAIIAESSILLLRRRKILATLNDGSAIVTAVLLTLSLPPLIPWWITVEATFFAIVIVKQIYGGLGYNIFNPAMAGYVFALISFPKFIAEAVSIPSSAIQDSSAIIFNLTSIQMDGLTAATPLDYVKTQLQLELNTEQISSSLNSLNSRPILWFNFSYFIGGLWLLTYKIIDWRIPGGILLSLFVISWFGYINDPAYHLSPWFHLFYTQTLFAAFFIATDPVTAATSIYGRWVYAIIIGIVTYIIRRWGSYTDGLAFAILFANLMVPTIDYYTQPKKYGY